MNTSMPAERDADVKHQQQLEHVAIFIAAILFLSILIGNMLIVLSVIKFERLHEPRNFYIISLAFADIGVGTMLMIVLLLDLHDSVATPGGDSSSSTALCVLPYSLLIAMCSLSMISLAIIAWDQYMALTKHLGYIASLTHTKVTVSLASIWLVVISITFTTCFSWYEPRTVHCRVWNIRPEAYLFLLVIIFCPTVAVLLFSYFKIFWVARRHARAVAAVVHSVQHNHKSVSDNTAINEYKYVKTLTLVVGTFLVLWLPILSASIVKNLGLRDVDYWTLKVLMMLAICNSALNPWLYAFRNTEYNVAFKRLWKSSRNKLLCLDLLHTTGTTINQTTRKPNHVQVVDVIPRQNGFDLHVSDHKTLDPVVKRRSHECLEFTKGSSHEKDIVNEAGEIPKFQLGRRSTDESNNIKSHSTLINHNTDKVNFASEYHQQSALYQEITDEPYEPAVPTLVS